MAKQLLENRNLQAYAGVEKYAARHAREDAGAMAQLVIGYAHRLDSEYALAIPALKKAQRAKTDLGDYIDYFLASAQEATGDARSALATLNDFDLLYPGSLLSREAAIIAANAMLVSGNATESIALLEKHRAPIHADVELAVGRAQEQAGEREKAIETFRRVYYMLPLAPEAAAADFELQKLAQPMPLPQASFAERKTRAELLLQNHRYTDAIAELRSLIRDAPPSGQPALQVSLGAAQWHTGKYNDARQLLEKLPEPQGEVGAQRLYYLVELYRPDLRKVEDTLSHMRSQFGESPWLQEALLSAANMYLLLKDNAHAQQALAELAQRFPRGHHAPHASWRAAWMQLQLGGKAAAAPAFERHIELFPASSEAAAAIYWRGRLAEEDSGLATARAYYFKASDAYRHSYYAELARQRLKGIDPASPLPEEPLLEKIQPPQPPEITSQHPPENSVRVQRSRLLENCALTDYAVRELQAAGSLIGANWTVEEVARLYSEDGRDYRAVETVKHALPGYFLFRISDLPPDFWKELFPRPYWDILKRYSAENHLDPFLVASLIRQESEFNPLAASRANALGLMQLLPGTGKKVARQVKLRGFNSSMLFDPAINLRLGTRYFRSLLDKYDGQLEYALAAYDAGPERVDEWRKNPFRDVAEFVESIPFTETREYVQAIMRNAEMYREIYATP